MSLRHTRLLRITTMLSRGERCEGRGMERVIRWKGTLYHLEHLERERMEGNSEHPNWDRIWRPMKTMERSRSSHRWRNHVGRRERRMFFAPLDRGVTTFYSAAQLRRLASLTMPRDLSGHPRKLTFEEFKKVWIR